MTSIPLLYWLLISVPLIYFLSQFIVFFQPVFYFMIKLNPEFYLSFFAILFGLSRASGGVLLGIVFFLISRRLESSILKNILTFCAFGFVFLYLSNEAILLIITPFPPFGILTTTFLSLSSLLIYIGISASAISVSGDLRLRKFIRQSTLEELQLLGEIGSAEEQKQIQTTVTRMVKKMSNELIQDASIPTYMQDADVRDYVVEVIKEVKNKKN
jgi:hypothetical protein